MVNLEITNNQTNGIVVWDPVFEKGVATFAGNEIWLAGTVLAKLDATGKYVRFTPGAVDGSGVPLAVLTESAEAIGAGGGDVAIRPLIAGRVRAGDLINNAGTALTAQQIDMLRSYSIIALGTQQLAEQDNG